MRKILGSSVYHTGGGKVYKLNKKPIRHQKGLNLSFMFVFIGLIVLAILNITMRQLVLETGERINSLKDEINSVKEEQKVLREQLDKLHGTHKDLSSQVKEWLEGKHMMLEGTAYTNNDPGMDGRGITFTGTKTKEWHTVAVDPNVIQLGSAIYIPQLKDTLSRGWFRAEDTGGAIKGNNIDIYFANRKDALRFGRQKLEAYIYESDQKKGR